MPPKRTGYSSYVDKYLKYKTERRIVMPPIPRRPLRFQLRTLIQHHELGGDLPWWLVVHRKGIRRARVGVDPLEARAMQGISGYLTERIMYKALVELMHFVPDVDFIFQSSVEGGRMEMGGLVADFVFPTLRIIINPTGPQHYQFRNMRKDDEQIAILAEMGYTVYMIDEDVCYDEYKLEEFLRRTFGWMGSPGGDSGGHPNGIASTVENDADLLAILLYQVQAFADELYNFFGR